MADITPQEFTGDGAETPVDCGFGPKVHTRRFTTLDQETFNRIIPEGLRVDVVFGTPEVDGGIVIPPEPVVTISPEAGTPMSSGTPWVATISGEDVSEILVWVSYADLNLVEVVFDGSDFTPNFKALSSRTVLSEAVQRLTVKRGAGWPSSPRFFIRVRNVFGGVNS